MQQQPQAFLSIVMPVRNEAQGIGQALQALAPLCARGVQLIVVDGGSSDDTLAQARRCWPPVARQAADKLGSAGASGGGGGGGGVGEGEGEGEGEGGGGGGGGGVGGGGGGVESTTGCANGAAMPSDPKHDARLINSAPGRALQMNAGARQATGQVLLFLHADTFLPAQADRLIMQALASGQRVWGRFDVRIAGRHRMLRVIAACMNTRSRWTGIATGDQGLFMTRAAFDAVGGFAAQALMEDIEMSQRLLRLSPAACLRAPVLTSGRRWETRGLWRTIFLMWRLRLAYWCGVSPQRLAQWYR